MKKTAIAILSSLVLAAPAFALVGGPWDNNVPGNVNKVNPSDMNGIYQGTIKGKNLSGIIRFTTSVKGTPITVTAASGASGDVVGYGIIFVEGKIAFSEIDVVCDPGAGKISGVMQGAGQRGLNVVLTRPATATTAAAKFLIIDSVYFEGYFSGNTSKSLALNSFSGKGSLLVQKVDIYGFLQALANPATAATAVPQVVYGPTSVKLAAVKTTNDAGYGFTVSAWPVIDPPSVTQQ